jgi:hypothetical protein
VRDLVGQEIGEGAPARDVEARRADQAIGLESAAAEEDVLGERGIRQPADGNKKGDIANIDNCKRMEKCMTRPVWSVAPALLLILAVVAARVAASPPRGEPVAAAVETTLATRDAQIRQLAFDGDWASFFASREPRPAQAITSRSSSIGR